MVIGHFQLAAEHMCRLDRISQSKGVALTPTIYFKACLNPSRFVTDVRDELVASYKFQPLGETYTDITQGSASGGGGVDGRRFVCSFRLYIDQCFISYLNTLRVFQWRSQDFITGGGRGIASKAGPLVCGPHPLVKISPYSYASC